MTALALEAASAAYLLFLVGMVTTNTMLGTIIHKFIPWVLGVFLGCLAFARFMGWPV
ncbi:hypothetical protein [Ancylobacter amanitiformis]|uniref:Uncharacterized protein n=1 Tax=Ancylobacter amanitiformis TaxID=217069 RepID=A0ABU0LQG9_9HYPH|nr:hypothetical protein [Ancylobacter amanitiformis]MDQ0510951.1 hypothetical protein [Ancylobacter amanitiformis]